MVRGSEKMVCLFVYIVTMGCQFLKTKAALNLKEEKTPYKNIQRL